MRHERKAGAGEVWPWATPSAWQRSLAGQRRRLHVSRYNLLRSLRRSLELRLRRRPLDTLWAYEQRFFSQNGEDGVLDALFRVLGTTNKFYVEFGTQDGRERNTRYLAEQRGWTGLLMDGGFEDLSINLRREFITAENINELFAKYGVPGDFDLLSIDVDGNDYWLWRSLSPSYRPRVVVIEYNASAGPEARRVVPYDPTFRWDGTDYFGASLAALADLGAEKGYRLAGCESMGVNAFFVRADLVPGKIIAKTAREAYQPPAYGPERRGHPHDPTRALREV